MAAPIWPNPHNCSKQELEVAMRAAPKQRAFVRMKVIHTLLRGLDHPPVAKVFAVSRKTLTRWIRNFNAKGIDGLIDARRAGRPPDISPEQSGQYVDLIEHPEQAGQVH